MSNDRIMEAFVRRVRIDDASGCHIWTGDWAGRGKYGRFLGDTAHRWIWEQVNGPIPPDHDLHHKCGNRLCVNIEHLEVMGHIEHQQAHRKKVCKNGHELTEENIYLHPKTGMIHGCKQCRKEATQRWYERQ